MLTTGRRRYNNQRAILRINRRSSAYTGMAMAGSASRADGAQAGTLAQACIGLTLPAVA